MNMIHKEGNTWDVTFAFGWVHLTHSPDSLTI